MLATAMDAVSTLAIFAQLAVSLTGFAGLLTAFHGGHDGWTAAEIAGIRNLLMTSVGALAFSILPIPALAGGVALRDIWAVASAALGAFLIALLAGGIDYVVRLKGRPRSRVFFWFFTLGHAPIALILFSAALHSSAGGALVNGVAPYLAGLIWLLAIGVVQFMFQIFSTLHQRS